MHDPAPVPALNFQVVPFSGDGFPTTNNEAFSTLLDRALSGGSSTGTYLDTILKFSTLATYLNEAGVGAYTTSDGPNHSKLATAGNGTVTLTVAVQLNDNLDEQEVNGVYVRGLASVEMSLPSPENIIKLAQFGISLAEIPPSIIVTQQLWQALFKPLLERLTSYVQTSIENWLELDVGNVDALGDAIESTTTAVAEDLSEETTEIVIDELAVAEVAIDLSAAIPAFAILGVLIAIPVLIGLLDKTFVLHIEVDNMTTLDLEWSIPYMEEGTMTAQPQSALIPQMGKAIDMWGDQSDVAVVYQAYYSSMNTSGFKGIGFALNFSPTGYTGQDIAVVIAIPWIADNAIWVGDPGRSPDWHSLYNAHAGSTGTYRATYGNQHFYTTLAIDALSGNSDQYHCVLRIEPI